MRRKIPVHLQTPDTLLLNMTARQTLIMGLGITLAYTVISSTWRVPLLLILAVILALTILALAFLIAFVTPKKRYLDIWAMVALNFLLMPKRYVWRPLNESGSARDLDNELYHINRKAASKKRENQDERFL